MKEFIKVSFALLALSPVALQGISEQRMGHVRVGRNTIYCRVINYDNGKAYILSFANRRIFGTPHIHSAPSIFIRWPDTPREKNEAFGHIAEDKKTLNKLKSLATDEVVREACQLEGFSWSKTNYRTFE